MSDPNYLEMSTQIEERGDDFIIRLPLKDGASEFIELAPDIGSISGDDLVVEIPRYVAEEIGVTAGSKVIVDNEDGTVNISADLK